MTPRQKTDVKKRVTFITEEYRFHLQLDVAKFLICSTKPNFTFRMLPKFIWLEDICMCYFKTTLSKECNKIVLTGQTKCPSNPLFCLQQQIRRIELLHGMHRRISCRTVSGLFWFMIQGFIVAGHTLFYLIVLSRFFFLKFIQLIFQPM